MKELDPGTKPPHQADKETQAWSLDEGSEPADSHSELEWIVQGLMLLVAGSRRCFANDKGQGHSHPSGLPWPCLQPGQGETAAIREHLLPG